MIDNSELCERLECCVIEEYDSGDMAITYEDNSDLVRRDGQEEIKKDE